jgi:UDP-N-acetyl-D-glucosamine dehydrogenase
VVPQYLQAAAREQGLISELIPAANRINDAMPRLIVNKLERALQQRLGKSLINARVLLVGITYKPDIADVRESAALRVFEETFARGAHVSYHDPLMPTVRTTDSVVASVNLDANVLASMDAIVLLTPHTSIDYERLIAAAPLVLDTHSGLQPREAPNVVNVWVPEGLDAPVLA